MTRTERLRHRLASPGAASAARWVLTASVTALVLLLTAPLPGAAQETPAPDAEAGLTTAVARQANLEGRVLWMDATANLERLSTRARVSEIFEKCRQANINTVVVDVKPLSGHVLYESRVAPRLREWKGFRYPENYDLLFTAMLEGRRRGIRVYASINVFSEAHKLLKSGPLYEDPSKQAIVYDVQRTLVAPDGARATLALARNTPPAPGEIVVYDGDGAAGKRLGADEAAVVAAGTSVTGLIDGSVATGGSLQPPKEGYLLIGRGPAAAWLLEHVQVGRTLSFAAQEVLQPILEAPSELVGGFVNPANPEARRYMLRVVEELANNYALDGIVFDRMRYSSLRTDFSPLSRELFEKWLGKRVERFPHDIYTYDPVPGRPVIPGPYFKEWLEWRARTINDWLAEAREVALRVRPGLGLGVYVGSWYPDYYHVGVNWGADDYHAGYDWMSPGYAATGYAGKLSWLSTGCYYPVATRQEARELGHPEEETVEAAARTSVRAVNDVAFVYAGLYLLDYQGKPDEFRRAMRAAARYSQGVMLFDLVYLEEYNWWSIVTELFATPKRAPHDVAGLQEAIRQTKRVLRPGAAPAGTPAPGGNSE